MNEVLTDRLNQILPKITAEAFLRSEGLGNEIAFYIFDYPPEDELEVRAHIQFLLTHIPQRKSGVRVKHLNLFDFVLDYLTSRNLLDKAILLQQDKGDDALKKALAGPLHENKLAPVFAEAVQPAHHDLVLLSGIGSVWPLLRSHTLLNNLHPIMGRTPLIMFYPGRYDGQSLRLFGKLPHANYYRAFKLIP